MYLYLIFVYLYFLFFFQIASGVVLMITTFLVMYTFHCTWVTSEAYSSPSIVLSARAGDGGRIIFDDFREAYYWLRHNTPEVIYDFALYLASVLKIFGSPQPLNIFQAFYI